MELNQEGIISNLQKKLSLKDSILLLAIVGIFFVGRCSALKMQDKHLIAIDSLNKALLSSRILELVHKHKSEVATQIAKDHENDKMLFQQKYLQEIEKNKLLTRQQKENRVKLLNGVSQADSSKLTDSLGNNILKLNAFVNKAKQLGIADSLTIKSLNEANAECDSAYQLAGTALENRNQTIKELKAIKPKLKWWQWPLVGAVAIGGFILGSL